MNQNDIINMAKECADEVTNGYGVVFYEFDLYGLEKFALLIRAAERKWQGLTDEEMMMIYGQSHEGKKYSLGRAIEAKLKEKNT